MAYGRAQRGTSDIKRVRMDGRGEPDIDEDLERLKARGRKNPGSAYESYKKQLHEFFDGSGKPLPPHIRDLLATRPGAEEHGLNAEEEDGEASRAPKKKPPQRRAKKEDNPTTGRKRRIVKSSGPQLANLVDSIRRTSSPRETEAAIDALREAGHPLPPDVDVLSKALGHSSEEVILLALNGLEQLVGEDALKGASLLKQRLANAALLTGSIELQQRCGALQQRLT